MYRLLVGGSTTLNRHNDTLSGMNLLESKQSWSLWYSMIFPYL